jgi:hypothetical protein
MKEPYIALSICALWGLYGGIYFLRSSKKKAKPAFVQASPVGKRVMAT